MASPLATPAPWDLVADGYTTHLLPMFERFAEAALAMAAVGPQDHVADVATGPGTLALLAAPRVARVAALDFAPGMVASLRRRVEQGGVGNVAVEVGDGQALPWPDASFDAGFSMFGLMFFPDRAKGFTELRRVLRPGGRAVVSSWTPADRVPLLQGMFALMRELLPDLPVGAPDAPLSKPETFAAELEGAGFREIRVEEVVQEVTIESVEGFWSVNEQSSAPIALLKSGLPPDAYRRLSDGMRERLVEQFGAGPLSYTWPALLGYGVR